MSFVKSKLNVENNYYRFYVAALSSQTEALAFLNELINFRKNLILIVFCLFGFSELSIIHDALPKRKQTQIMPEESIKYLFENNKYFNTQNDFIREDSIF